MLPSGSGSGSEKISYIISKEPYINSKIMNCKTLFIMAPSLINRASIEVKNHAVIIGKYSEEGKGSLFARHVEKFPTLSEAMRYIESSLAAETIEGYIKCLEQILDLYPDDNDAKAVLLKVYNRASAYYSSDKVNGKTSIDAVSVLEKALILDPENENTRIALCVLNAISCIDVNLDFEGKSYFDGIQFLQDGLLKYPDSNIIKTTLDAVENTRLNKETFLHFTFNLKKDICEIEQEN